MNWKRFAIAADDARGKSHVLANLSVGQFEHCPLSGRLAERLKSANGPMFVIAQEAWDVDRLTDFRWAGTYAGGKLLSEAVAEPLLARGSRAIDGLMAVLGEWLRSAADGIVIMEHYLTSRARHEAAEPLGKPAYYCGEHVYHVLTAADTDAEQVEDTLRAPWDDCLVGICSEHVQLPPGQELSEKWLDDAVCGVRLVFAAALDGEGFLVWSPNCRMGRTSLRRAPAHQLHLALGRWRFCGRAVCVGRCSEWKVFSLGCACAGMFGLHRSQ